MKSVSCTALPKGRAVFAIDVYNDIIVTQTTTFNIYTMIEAYTDSDIYIDKDSHLDYTVIELKRAIGLGEDELEKSFEAKRADETASILAMKHYQNIISTPKAFVGFGNTAFVYKEHPNSEQNTQCIKCRWDFLMVNNKSKKITSLPPSLQPLKRIEIYFKEVDRKKRGLQEQGYAVVTDNSTLREAILQHLASQLLKEAGMSDRIPDVNLIIQIHREESGNVKGDVYAATESVNLVFMEQIQGMTVEEMIYEPSDIIADKLDIELIVKELKEIVAVLHEGGIAHRDLSIRNIMLDEATLRPHLIDFGKSTYSTHLSEDDKQRDLDFVDEAIRFIRKFKKDPQKTSLELKKLHED